MDAGPRTARQRGREWSPHDLRCSVLSIWISWRPGDEIVVQTAIGFHTFEVTETLIVSPSDVWVTEPRDGAWLTLTTCHPKASARQRLVIVARLVDGPNFEFVQSLLSQSPEGAQS